jgi:amidase
MAERERLAGDLVGRSALALAALVRSGQVSAREVVQAHLDRIVRVNGAVNAVTWVLADSALVAADRLDRARAGGAPLGPLAGVPVTVKENHDLAGTPTTLGVRALAGQLADQDAPAVAQLRAAGAIPIARTNLPDLMLRWHTDSSLHGATRNPWDPARTPGGSSGGDAVAVATGMAPLGLGSDLGGSLRVPALSCGVAALRPTPGRVPFAGAPARPPSMTQQLFAVPGPVGRDVADLHAALATLAGPDPADPWSLPVPLEDPASWPRGRRVAVTLDPGGGGVDPIVAEGVGRAAEALERAGWQVQQADPPDVEAAAQVWMRLVCTEVAATRAVLEQLVGPDARTFLRGALAFSPPLGRDGLVAEFARRTAIARRWAEFLAVHQLVLGPIATEPLPPEGYDLGGPDRVGRLWHCLRLVVAVNALGLPAVAVPVGRHQRDRLPLGVQLIAGRFQELHALAAAGDLQAAFPPLTPIDPAGRIVQPVDAVPPHRA